MFETIKNWFINNWKKLLASVGAFVLSFLLFKFVLAPLLTLTVVSIGGAVAVALLVWFRVAWWEIQALAGKAGVKL